MSDLFLVLAVLSALWGVVDAILMAVALDRRGVRVNLLMFRVYFFRYLRQYKEVTLTETGRVGPLYYSYIIAMCLALVFAVVGIAIRVR
jgi:hypothetical protein